MLMTPLIRRMMVLGTAIAVGSLFAPTQVSLGVSDGDCRAFTGESSGNDPSQNVVLHLCRDGETITGIKSSSGEAGYSSFHLSGQTTKSGGATLKIDEVLEVSTSEGWITCTDDVFQFQWSERQQALVGRYDSAACADHAEMRLVPVDAADSLPNHCGLYRH